MQRRKRYSCVTFSSDGRFFKGNTFQRVAEAKISGRSPAVNNKTKRGGKKMDPKATTVLISIHPKYVDLISAGKKKIEFRKRSFSHPIKRFVVYSTAPVSKVVGFFDVDSIVCDSPQKLWETYAAVGGIEQNDYFDYYANKSMAVGIRIKNYTPLSNSFNIKMLNTTPPQSYKYLTDREFDLVRDLGKIG